MFCTIHYAGDAVLFSGGRVVSVGYVPGTENDIGNIAVSIPVIFTGEDISWKAFHAGGNPRNRNTGDMVSCSMGNISCGLGMWKKKVFFCWKLEIMDWRCGN